MLKRAKAAGRNEIGLMEVAFETTRPLQLCISMKPPSLGRGGGQGRKRLTTKREEADRETKAGKEQTLREQQGDPGKQRGGSGKGQPCSSSTGNRKQGMWEVETTSEKENRTMECSRIEKKEPGGLGLGRS